MKYNFNYIIDYIINYDCGVPMSVIIGLSIIVSGIIVILFHYHTGVHSFIRNVSWCFLIAYIFFIFCTTILFRAKADDAHYIFNPFWSYHVLYDRLLAQNILNVLMFIPIGFLIGGSLRKDLILKNIGIGCGISLTIEYLQLVTKRGVCNIDDVIHNTLGCALGYVLFLLCRLLFSKALLQSES